MSVSIGGVIFLIITIGCAVKATQNWRAFRAGKNRPLLTDVTAAELAAIPTEWPLRRDRWPPPWSDGKPAMEMQFARAYSLLAERIRRNLLLAAEVLLIVGGSWLGVTLDDIWVDYRESSADATERLEAGTSEFAEGLPSLGEATNLLPLGVIAAGAMCLWLARQYETAQQLYQKAATPHATPVSVAADSQRRGLGEILRALVRRA